MADGGENGRRDVTLSLQAVLGIATLFFVVVAAGWTLFQSQFNYAEKDKELIRAEIARRETELKEQLRIINAELTLRRAEFVNQDEHREFRRRLEGMLASLDARVASLEAKNPSREFVATLMNSHIANDHEVSSALRRELDAIHRDIDKLVNGRRPYGQQKPPD